MSTDLHSHQFTRCLAAVIVVVAMLLAAISLWTAIPLSWIYIASMLSRTQFPTGGPYMVLFSGIIISVTLVGWLLARLGDLYVRITGMSSNRDRASWLKSVRDTSSTRPSSPQIVETVLVGSIALAVLILVAWFFIFSAGAVPNAPLG